MIARQRTSDIALGVECAWPVTAPALASGSVVRRHRLAEAWRRVLAVFRWPLRQRWAG